MGRSQIYLERPGCFNLSDERRDPEVVSVYALREANFRTGANPFAINAVPTSMMSWAEAGAARAVAIVDPPGFVFKPDSAVHAGYSRVGRQVEANCELSSASARPKAKSRSEISEALCLP